MKKDSLFDNKFTWMDAIKVSMLVVTMFSTWNIVDIMTPDTGWAFFREVAAVFFVEGAFLVFEYATTKSKSQEQVKHATNGFFFSLAVIVVFALVSGGLEFGGDALLLQPAGAFFGLDMLARDWVMVGSLLVLAAWIGGLGTLLRLFDLADPDKIAELEKIKLNDEVSAEANEGLKQALEKAKPVISIARAKASIRNTYKDELKPDEMDRLVGEVELHLATHYQMPIQVNFTKKEASTPSPLAGADGDD